MLLSFYPLFLFPSDGGFILPCVTQSNAPPTPLPSGAGECVCMCYCELPASGVPCREEYDVNIDGFFFLALGSTWGPFYMFANILSYLALHWPTTSNYIQTYYIWCVLLTLSTCSLFFFVNLENRHFPGPALYFLTVHCELFVVVKFPVLSLCPIFCHPMPVHYITIQSCVSTSQGLSCHTRPVFLYTASLC